MSRWKHRQDAGSAIQGDVRKHGVDALSSSLRPVCRKYGIFSNDIDALQSIKIGVSRATEHSFASIPVHSNQGHKEDIALIIQGITSLCSPHVAHQGLQAFLAAVRRFIVRVCAKERAPMPNVLTAPPSSAGATTQTDLTPAHTVQGPLAHVPERLPPALSSSVQLQPSPVDPRLQPRPVNWGHVHEVPFTSCWLVLPRLYKRVVSMHEQAKSLGGALLKEHELFELAHFLDARILDSIRKEATANFSRPSREQVQRAYQIKVEIEHAKFGDQKHFLTLVDDFYRER